MRPIVILAMPRSGSSMTAGLFAAHGVWFGECRAGDVVNAKGYFENTAIKQEMIRRWGKLTRFEKRLEPQADFRERIEQIIDDQQYRSGPWGYKMSALYRPAWDCFDPYYVGVKRLHVKQANLGRQSMLGTSDPERVQRMIDLHDEIIDKCEVIVKTDELVRRNYQSLAGAFEYCGLELNEKVADDFIEPSLWHY